MKTQTSNQINKRLLQKQITGLSNISTSYSGLKIRYKKLPSDFFKKYPLTKNTKVIVNKSREKVFTEELDSVTKSVLRHQSFDQQKDTSLPTSNSNLKESIHFTDEVVTDEVVTDEVVTGEVVTGEVVTGEVVTGEALSINDITDQVLSEMDELERTEESILYIEDFDYKRSHVDFESSSDLIEDLNPEDEIDFDDIRLEDENLYLTPLKEEENILFLISDPDVESSSESIEIKQNLDGDPPLNELENQPSQNSPVDWMDIEPIYISKSYDKEIEMIYSKEDVQEPDFSFFMEKFKECSGCKALTILFFNNELSVYQRILDCGLDEITAKNLYFGYQDKYIDENKKWQTIIFTKELAGDFHFQKKMSSDFFHAIKKVHILNLKEYGYDAYIQFFYENTDAPSENSIEQDLLPVLSNILPMVSELVKKNWYYLHQKSNPLTLLNDQIFFALKRVSRGGREKINVLHIAFENILDCTQTEEKLQKLFSLIKKTMSDGSEFISLSAHKFMVISSPENEINFLERIEEWAEVESITIKSKLFEYPNYSNNLFNFIAPSW